MTAAVLAVVPLLVILGLVITAVSDDSYYGDGTSYWDAHSEDGVRPLVVLAIVINAAVAAALIASVRTRPRLMAVAGIALAAAGIAFGVFAWIGLRTGH